MKETYTIGMDYGTLSGRGVLVRCWDGKVLASAVKEYVHGVMDDYIPGQKEPLPPDWCLQNPMDYLDVLEEVIPRLLRESSVDKRKIQGIGIDFTACTVLPVDTKGVPLCMDARFQKRRNAYVKLWKHHGAQPQADKVNALLEEKNLLKNPVFGGKISPELMTPKVLEMIDEDYELYMCADEILEAGDWLTRTLTGSHKRSCSMAGYKMWWNGEKGYPDSAFFKALDERMERFPVEKLPGQVCGIGEKIGSLSAVWAERLGLEAGIAVAPTVIDSHAGFPGSGIYKMGQMMMVLGTSSVVLSLSKTPYSQKGIYGGIKDCIVPGYYAWESGLAAVGDLFGWFVENLVPIRYYKEAETKNVDIHSLLSEKASRLEPGESGLLALDWWNGNKTPHVDGNLNGVLLGLTLHTKPEEIYRALMEATAFGTRAIVELFREGGACIDQVVASGGITSKNKLMMQIYADVLGMDIKIAASDQTAALGSAIYAALAVGGQKGGYDSYEEAVTHMSRVKEQGFYSNRERKQKYDELYAVYKNSSMLLGDDRRDLLKELYDMKMACRKERAKNGIKQY